MQIINFGIDNLYTSYKMRMSSRGNNDKIIHFPLDGFSTENDYVPFYAAWNHKGLHMLDGKPFLLHYGIINRLKPIILKSNYQFLYDNLNRSSLPGVFSTGSMDFKLHVMKGLIFEVEKENIPKVHLLVAVKSDYMFRMDKNNLDLRKFVVFLSTEFTNDKKYASLYSKIRKDVLIGLQEAGVDTIITNNINQWCYKNSLILPKFKTLQEKINYLDNFNTYTLDE